MEPTMATAETPLARAQQGLAEAEHAWRDESAQLVALQNDDRRLGREIERLETLIRQAEDRATIRDVQEQRTAVEHQRTEVKKDIAAQELVVAKRAARVEAARQAIDAVQNQAALLRGRLRQDEAEARQLEQDITRAEGELATWRRGLTALESRMAATQQQLGELGM